MLEWWRRVGLACDDHERGAGRTDVISRATAPSFRGRQARPLVEEFTDAPGAMTTRRRRGVRRVDRVEGSSFASKCLASMVCGSGRSRLCIRSCARVAVASMAYNPYSEVVESLWNDYPDAQDEAVSRASMLAQGSLRVCRIMHFCASI